MTTFDISKIKDTDIIADRIREYGQELVDRQLELERWSNERGEAKFLKNYERQRDSGRFAETNPGQSAISVFYPVYAEAIQWQLNKSQRGARAAWKNLLDQHGHLKAQDIALISLRTILGLVCRGEAKMDQQVIARKVMDNLKTEMITREFAKLEPLAVQDRMARANKKGESVEVIKKDVKAQMASRMLTWEPEGWDNSGNVVSGGVALIHMLHQSCPGVIELSSAEYDGKKSYVYVTMHEDLQDKIDQRVLNVASEVFTALPLLIRPREWSSENLAFGGYFSSYVRNYPLVKKSRKLYNIEIQNSTQINGICEAVNAMQATGWRINQRMLEVKKWLFEHDQDILGGYVRSELPEKPSFTPEYFEENKQECRLELFKWHEANRSMKSERLQTMTLIQFAEMFAQEHKFYFAWDMDSRGRAYAITSSLSPQGSDWNKHLMQFAEGQVIEKDSDMDGIRFAAANAMGHDKLPIADRIQWTKDNIEQLIAVGRDPKSNLLWTEADEPACFLAACFELADYADQGVGFVSRMPVAVDATCSGLQILSALSRDEVGGKMVNLTADPKRHDIYAAVAEGPLRRRLEECARGELGKYADWVNAQEFAQAALDYGFDRKLVKRVVMTVPYSAQEDSCRKYVREYYHDRIKKDGKVHESFNNFTVFISRLLWDSIPEVVVKGLDVMGWLQSVSVAAMKANNQVGLQWSTPDGFVGRTSRPKIKQLRPRVYIYDYSKRDAAEIPVTDSFLKTQQWLDEEDPRQHKNSCAPNFVHALDSTVLRAVVRRWNKICALRHTKPEFAMIHDSFAVGTRDFTEFNTIIREEFVKLFEQNDPLEDYEQAMREIAGPDAVFPPKPARGSLEIREILKSEYFFS